MSTTTVTKMNDPRKMSEKDLQNAIAELAQMLGYMVFHARPAMNKDGSWVTPVKYNGKGFPDLTIVGHGHVLFVEVKSAKGVVSPEQAAWIQAMLLTDNYAAVWYPSDWRDGYIEKVLRSQLSVN